MRWRSTSANIARRWPLTVCLDSFTPLYCLSCPAPPYFPGMIPRVA